LIHNELSRYLRAVRLPSEKFGTGEEVRWKGRLPACKSPIAVG